ncbi:MAG: hypothetical protein M5U28_13380 [Sandaracinaceae bacterium]|nr:hypothetical protein [Sandaracinaceae bacterium]
MGRSGQVYAAAHYAVPVDFGGGERPAAAVTNGVILALDATGTYRWDRVFTSPTSATLSGVDAKLDGVVAVGWFGDSLTVGGSTLAGSTFESSVLIEFSPEGAVRRSRTFAATANNAAVDVVVGIGDSTAVVGRWQGSITLEGTTYLSRTSSGGGASPDVYIIRPAGI